MNQNALAAGRESASLFSLAGRAQIAVRGADRAKFLHNFCTNDVLGLQPGQGCEAFFCNVKGRVLAYATLFATADALWIDSESGSAESLLAHLDRYIIREDVVLEDHTAKLTELAFVGPQAAAALSQMLAASDLEALSCPGIREFLPLLTSERRMGAGVSSAADGLDDRSGKVEVGRWREDEEQYSVVPSPLPSDFHLRPSALDPGASKALTPVPVWHVRCVPWLRERTYLLTMPTEHVEPFVASCPGERGEAADWESLRIAAGFPKYGVDITADNLPQEIALNDRCISFRKGCYLGQEPVARLDALGHTNKELRRLRIDAATLPAVGTPLTDPASGQPVGQITSAAKNPDGTGIVAVGYLKTKWNAAGTVVSWGTPPQSATVVDP